MSENRLCPSCQAVLRPNARFCEECGAPAPAAAKDAPQPRGKRDWRPWLAVGAALALPAAVYLPGWLIPNYRDAREQAQAESSSEVTLYAADNVMRRQKNGGGPERALLRRGDAVTGTVVSDGDKTWLVTSDNGDHISTGRLMDTPPPELAQQYDFYRWDLTAPVDVHAGDSSLSPVVKQLDAGTPILIIGLTESGFLEFKLKENAEVEGYIDADDLGFDAEIAEAESLAARARAQIFALGLAQGKPLSLKGTVSGTAATLDILVDEDGETLTGLSTYVGKAQGASYECAFDLRFTGLDAQQRLLFDQVPISVGQNLISLCGVWSSLAIALPEDGGGDYAVEWAVDRKRTAAARLMRAAAK